MTARILIGHVLDRLAELPGESVHCCVTSPPYFALRDYQIEPQLWPDGWRGSLGLEPTPALYIEHMVAVFRAVRRVLRKDGTLWLNIGDSYAASGGFGSGGNAAGMGRANQQRNLRPGAAGDGIKPKDLIGVPWALAFALREDGWWLRSEITWAKRAPMPESVTDRPTSATEKVFLLSKSARYFYDAEAVKEKSSDNAHAYGSKLDPPIEHAGIGHVGFRKGTPEVLPFRAQRNFWLLGPEPFPEAHFATFVTEIPRRAILAGTSERGVCPECGAPWERVVDRETRPNINLGVHAETGGRPHRNPGGGVGADQRKAYDVGWRPTCGCDMHPAAPATVLDPFLGSGTTALVADRLGRDCIGIELSEAYAEMARRRIADDAGMFAEVAAE